MRDKGEAESRDFTRAQQPRRQEETWPWWYRRCISHGTCCKCQLAQLARVNSLSQPLTPAREGSPCGPRRPCRR